MNDNRNSQVVALTQELVRFDTVNPPGNEDAAIRHLGAFLEGRGIDVTYQELEPGRTNLIARLSGEAGSGHLVFSGHIDVVHPGAGSWDSPPFEARIDGDRMIGRGTADMKGGVAAMAVALTQLVESGLRPKADVILAVSAGEEVDTSGARLMAATGVLEGSREIVVGEPTGLDVFIAEKGVLWLKITAHGRTAHGSMPQLGVNAISYVIRLAQALEEYPFAYRESAILGKPTISINTIDGGVKTNVVADRCEMSVDLRLVPGQDRESVLGRLEEILADVAKSTGLAVRTEVEVLQDMPPVETSKSEALVGATIDAAEKVRGSKPSLGGVSYGTDGAVLAPALGAAVVIFGPGSPGQAHQPNEFVELLELEMAVEAYREIAQALLGGAS